MTSYTPATKPALRRPLEPGLFADLADTSEAQEQAAIEAGLIQAVGIRYAATRG